MKKVSFFVILICLLLSATGIGAENLNKTDAGFAVGKGKFLLEGQPYVVKAAELHYPRIPKEYWDHRIKMSKALGMNTICMYVFWNFHEEKEGEFDFTGQKDIREFIKLCGENGMNVILRPGPYVCAEWEMGGLPWWLLKDKDIQLRENDPRFLKRVEKFEEAVAKQIGDLTIDKGGPIIMIQVENEYGAYGENKEYISAIRDILRKNYGDDVLLFQCDWSSNYKLNGLEDLLWTLNFGTGADIDSQFASLKQERPDQPLMCSEFWSGWFDKWGAGHETRSADEMIAGIDEMLSKDISFSLYMTHGGTNWGHWAGANSPGYSPDVTSYDYDAPIDERGAPTEKYWLLRDVMAKYLNPGEKLEELPERNKTVSIEKFSLTEVAPLFKNLPKPLRREDPATFEDLDMGFGSILYSTIVPEKFEEGSLLTIEEPHDYAQIFIDGKKMGVMDRRKGETQILLPWVKAGDRMDILVEGMGRINFGRAIKDFKGITGKVAIIPTGNREGIELKGWDIFLLPDSLEFYNELDFEPITEFDRSQLPIGVYKGKFNVKDTSDTFLNFETWGKGLVYVNGYGLGRIWNEGPQQTLYLPGPWLKEGENEILIFDIIGPTDVEVEGLETPIIDKLRNQEEEDFRNQLTVENIENLTPVADSRFEPGNGMKEIRFNEAVKGNRVIIEISNTYDKEPQVSVAELYLIDDKGERLSRETWKITTDSFDRNGGNHEADKIIDLQESTYWSSDIETAFPHYIMIETSQPETIGGLQYLPRMESGAPGSIKDFRIFIVE